MKRSLRDARYAFADELEDEASARYLDAHLDGSVRRFEFHGASFLFDDRPGIDRTILVMAPPTVAGVRDRSTQRGYPLGTLPAGRDADRGHLIAHSAGGAFGPNIITQDRALNRGSSPDGAAYRRLERDAVAAGSDALLFVRPDYIDDTAVPAFLELGYWEGGRVHARTFRNRFDDPALSGADRFRAAVDGATNAQAGALGEETARVLLERDHDAQPLDIDDAGRERDAHRHGLDLLVMMGDSVVAVEVKTRHVGRLAGRRTRAGDLLRPRLRAASDGTRQGSEAYVDIRADRIIDVGHGMGRPEVQVMVVDLVAMLAQRFAVDASGRVGRPSAPPTGCEAAAREAFDTIVAHRGHL